MGPASYLHQVPVFAGVDDGRLGELEAAAETRGRSEEHTSELQSLV